VAVHVRPEILLVDEVLAVGDAEFQSKCYAHIEKLRAENVTIVVVSHDLWSVARFCDRVLLMGQGRITMDGPPQPVMHEYLSRIALLANLPTPVTSSGPGIEGVTPWPS
jgi:ABC-type polysaccharide/polyol phosphate transport system ATPase subunit